MPSKSNIIKIGYRELDEQVQETIRADISNRLMAEGVLDDELSDETDNALDDLSWELEY